MVAGDAKPDGVAVMKPDNSALEVRGLTKRFDRLAVDSLDLTIRAGEFYALVGPNGAGKTTSLRMADRIGVIASGRLVAEGTLAELRQQNGHADTSLEDLFIALVTLQAAA